jgi:hypothetical protein
MSNYFHNLQLTVHSAESTLITASYGTLSRESYPLTVYKLISLTFELSGSCITISVLSVYLFISNGQFYRARKQMLIYVTLLLILATSWFIAQRFLLADPNSDTPSRNVDYAVWIDVGNVSFVLIYLLNDGVLVS